MKEISIFHQHFGTIDAFIYKAYYIDFLILKEGVDRGGGGTEMEGAESGVEGAESGGRGGGKRE